MSRDVKGAKYAWSHVQQVQSRWLKMLTGKVIIMPILQILNCVLDVQIVQWFAPMEL